MSRWGWSDILTVKISLVSIFILHGKDNFRRQLKLSSLKEKYIDPGMEALCFTQSTKPELMDFISMVQTPAMGFGKKLIVIKNFKYLENRSDDSDVESIISTLENIPEVEYIKGL